MKTNKMHYEGESYDAGVCGMYVDEDFVTTDSSEVTCKSCLKKMGKVVAALPKVDFAVTNDVIKAMDFLSTVLLNNQRVKGYCGEYDNIVMVTNKSLPAGMRLRERFQNYTVTVEYQGASFPMFAKRMENAKAAEDDVRERFYDTPLYKGAKFTATVTEK